MTQPCIGARIICHRFVSIAIDYCAEVHCFATVSLLSALTGSTWVTPSTSAKGGNSAILRMDEEKAAMNNETKDLSLKDNVSRRSIWIRLVFMIVLGIAYGVAEIVAFAVVVFQFLSSLFTGRHNERLARFGRNLGRYFQQITLFMTFATEEKPFPFGQWPDEPHEVSQPGEGEPTVDEPVMSDDHQENAVDNTAGGDEAEPKKRKTRRSTAKPESDTNPDTEL